MRTAVYFDMATGEAQQVSSGPPGVVFADPAPGQGVLLLDSPCKLPGYVHDGAYVERPERPSKWHEWDAESKTYTLPAGVLSDASAAAQAQIDAAAGRARLRYITDVPGQQETYRRKGEQARQWAAAGFPETVPSYIAAEARRTKSSPQAVAEKIIELEHLWVEIKGPEVESARIGWKEEVRAATTLEAVHAALDAALAELEAL